MAIYQITINPGSNSQPASVHGSVGWSGDPAHVQTLNMFGGEGSTWIIWQIGAVGIPSGQVVNAVVVSGNHFFNVYGGSGTSRYCTVYCKTATTLAGITGTGDSIAAIPGTASTVAVSAQPSLPGGLTSTQLLAGQFYLGYAVKTGTEQPGLGPGFYSTTALTFTFYTGADTPSAPGGPSWNVTNPVGNQNPGKSSGQQFSPLTWDYYSPRPQSSLITTWTLSSAHLTWVSTGNQTYTMQKGDSYDPGNAYNGTTPAINIAAAAPGGTYAVTASMTGYLGATPSTVTVTKALVVISNLSQGWFMEF